MEPCQDKEPVASKKGVKKQLEEHLVPGEVSEGSELSWFVG